MRSLLKRDVKKPATARPYVCFSRSHTYLLLLNKLNIIIYRSMWECESIPSIKKVVRREVYGIILAAQRFEMFLGNEKGVRKRTEEYERRKNIDRCTTGAAW